MPGVAVLPFEFLGEVIGISEVIPRLSVMDQKLMISLAEMVMKTIVPRETIARVKGGIARMLVVGLGRDNHFIFYAPNFYKPSQTPVLRVSGRPRSARRCRLFLFMRWLVAHRVFYLDSPTIP